MKELGFPNNEKLVQVSYRTQKSQYSTLISTYSPISRSREYLYFWRIKKSTQ